MRAGAGLVAAADVTEAVQRRLERVVVVQEHPLLDELVSLLAESGIEFACTSRPIVSVVDSRMVGDLRTWLYERPPSNYDRFVGADPLFRHSDAPRARLQLRPV